MLRIALVTDSGKSMLAQLDPHSRLRNEVTRNAVFNALVELGHEVEIIEVGPNLLNKIEAAYPDAIFNLATGYKSKKQQANIAAMLELTDIPFTGSGLKAHTIAMHKDISKMIFQANEISTPRFAVFNDAQELGACSWKKELPFPVVVKPAAEGSSIGIYSHSVTCCSAKVKELAFELLDTVGGPILVEEFISGREFTVALVGYPEPIVLPIEEIVFHDEVLYTYEAKASDNVTPICPAEIPIELARDIQDMARKAFKSVGCRDIARVDLRVSEDGIPYVLEINTLPGLTPGYSEVPKIAEAANIRYQELIGLILKGALKRREQSQTENGEHKSSVSEKPH